VQVEVHDVHPAAGGIDQAHDGVHVGAVIVHQSAFAVYDFGDVPDVGLEKTQGVGIGQHDAGRFPVHELRHGPGFQDPFRARLHRHGFIAAQGGAGRVGAVGGIGDEDFGSFRPAAFVPGGKDQDAGQFSLGAGGGLHGDTPGSPVMAARNCCSSNISRNAP
jgi:hypothetical protein